MTRSSWAYLSSFIALACVAGCSGGSGSIGTVAVTGVVTLDGQPVEGATVNLIPKSTKEGGRAAVGMTDAAGRFKLTSVTAGDGVVPGSYGVTVTKAMSSAAADPPSDPRAKGGSLSPDDLKSISEMARKASSGKGGPRPTAGQSALPKKYASADTSGFNLEVKSGEKNELNLPLTSR